MRTKKHIISVDIYNCDLVLYITNHRYINKLYKKTMMNKDDKAMYHIFNNEYTIFLTVTDLDVVAHETVHAAIDILRNVGALDINNDEPIAYLAQYLFREIYNVIKEIR